MFSVVIPTRNSEEGLARTLSSLVAAAADGLVREVLVVDGGSTDGTAIVAEATGCSFLVAHGPIGERLARGAEAARRGEWLMFLRPGVMLEPGWHREIAALLERIDRAGGRGADRALVFRYARDELGAGARLDEVRANLLSGLTGLAHPSQGLALSRRHYRSLGGYRSLPALEDVDLLRRIGRLNRTTIRARAIRVGRFDDGSGLSTAGLRRGLSRLLAGLAVPPRLLVRLHGGGKGINGEAGDRGAGYADPVP
ncbi:glycosyltransferase [Methylobrevis pamukkalensis]|uniref:Glycosyl transferase family 2 n=1 Tax=Methylobrevis pamukkalensis TaxID=1439726 RepID=A0A1E3GZI4_9HYPH|nr:glycosyltransferase [Methylobrevis pamukkalensis]ODN69444.1 Glycosyl transferase family 2 [Methylobrevis pamukkalensis]